MIESNKLEEISKFIKKTAKEQEVQCEKLQETKKVKEYIDNFSTPTKKDFTFTVGEMNAYLG